MNKLFYLLLISYGLSSLTYGQSLNPRGFAPDGSVFAMKRNGNILYVGGGFNRVGIHTGGSAFFSRNQRLPEVDRAYVFGDVYTSIPDGRGGRFMGGNFSKVNGTVVSNLVHILPNETVDPAFTPAVDGAVETLALINDTLFFGGNFQTVDGTSRPYLAAWDINQGVLTNWNPQANGRVYTMKILNGFIYAGGAFSRIGPYDQIGLAKIDRLAGQSQYIPSADGGTVFDMDADQGLLYTVGDYTGASGYYTGQGAEVIAGRDVPVYEFPATNGTVHEIISDGNGGWFIAGAFFDVAGQRQARLAHILPDYTLDGDFTPEIGGTVNSMALINDTLFFGGNFRTVDGQSRERLAAYDFANNQLTPWNPGASAQVNTLIPYEDAILAGGNFDFVDSLYVSRLAWISRRSGVAQPIASPSSGNINSLVIVGNTLYAAGSFNGSVGDPAGRVARLTSEDSLPPLPFAEFNGTVETIISDGQGGWYVGGAFLNTNNGYSGTIRRLAHVLPDYTIDPNFILNPNNIVHQLLLVNNTLYIAGNFTQIDGQTRNRIAAYDIQNGTLTNFNPDVNNSVLDLGAWNDTMMIVGAFTTVGGQARERIAMVNTQSGSVLPFSMPVNNTVNTLAWNDTMMFIGGRFSLVDGQTRSRIARISRTNGSLSPVATNVNNDIQDLALAGNLLYMGGSFTSVDGQNRSRLASISLTTQALTSWDPAPDNTVQVMRVFNDTMMVGGNFGLISGQSLQRLAKINRFSGNPYSWSPKPDNTVFTLALNGSEVLAGGSFKTVRSTNRQRLFALDLNTFRTNAFAPEVNGTIEELNVFNDTMLLAGNFTQIDGQPRQRVASIHRITQGLGPLSLDIDNTVFSLAVFNDTMMLGGRFDLINGQAHTKLAAVTYSTGIPISWQPEPSSDVLKVVHAGDQTVVGGQFTTFKTKNRNRAMALDLIQDSIHGWNPNIAGAFFASANCLHIDPDLIYIGGRFGAIGDSTATNLGAVDKIRGVATGQSIPIGAKVWDITTVGDSILFVGEFTDVDAVFRRYAAGLNKQNWELNNWKPELEDDGFLLEQEGQELMVGGKFFMTNTVNRKNGYAINLATQEILPWDPDPNNIIREIAFDQTGEKVFVVGGFSEIGGERVSYFTALDPTFGRPIPGWNFDISNPVNDMAINPVTQSIYLGGRFTSLGAQTRNRLAVIDSAGSLLPTQVDFDGDIRSIAFRDTILYASGGFEQVNGTARNKIAAITGSGQLLAWEPTHDTPFFNEMGEVVASPEKIFLQGSFDQINGQDRSRIAAVGPMKGILDDWNPRLARGNTGASFSVSTIYPIGSDVFVGGTFTSARGTPVQGMARFNIESGVIQPPVVSFPFSTLFAFESFEDQLFFAGDFDSVEQTFQPNFASLTFEPAAFSSRVTGITPEQGGNTGDVTVKIYGFGFKPGARVILRKAGFPDLYSLDSANVITAGREIRASFILRGAEVGMRDVYVEIPGDTTYVIPNGFEIVPGEEPDVWVEMIGPDVLRNRAPTRFVVNYGNKSNIDAVGVPVWMVLPRSFQVQAYSVKIAEPRDSTQEFYDQIPPYYDIDSIGDEAFPGRLYVFTIPKIPANSSAQFSFRFRPTAPGPFRYKIWISKPMFGSPLKRLAGECIDEILVDLLGLVPGAGCALGVMEATLCPMLDYADPESGFGSEDYVMDWGAGLAETVITCGLEASVVGGIIADIIKIILTTKNNAEILEKCSDQYGEEDGGGGGGNVIQSFDPNNKIGLQGEGSQGWLNTDQVFSYLINFENVDTATAAAQQVIIYDTLDTQVFDVSTLQLGFFTLADSLYKIPAGLQQYEVVIDPRPRLPMYVKFSANLDRSNGALTFRYESIDTTSLKALTDPILGLLPPNTDSISGTGSVFYHVGTFSDLPTGTVMNNKADIVFDFNDPIITDPWINTADNDLPASMIQALPDTMTSTLIPLRWTGSDVGSGIRYYNIYYSKNGDQWLTAGYQLSDTSMVFEADPGAKYRFYSIAYDTARNRERIPLMHDAETYVPLSVSVDAPATQLAVQIFPNPNNGTFTIEFASPTTDLVGIDISNSVGQHVYRRNLRLLPGTSTQTFNLALPAGIYHVLIQSSKGRVFRKLEIK